MRNECRNKWKYFNTHEGKKVETRDVRKVHSKQEQTKRDSFLKKYVKICGTIFKGLTIISK